MPEIQGGWLLDDEMRAYGAKPSVFHTPGGKEHDQKGHGNWSNGQYVGPMSISGKYDATVPSMGPGGWMGQIGQHPDRGKPGMSMTVNKVGKYKINTLLYRDEEGIVRGILYHYPQDAPGLEEKGNFNVLVDPLRQRQGIGAKLVREAGERWNVSLWGQDYTPEGAALARAVTHPDLVKPPKYDKEGWLIPARVRKHSLDFHTPGGVEHDQQTHGNWSYGAHDITASSWKDGETRDVEIEWRREQLGEGDMSPAIIQVIKSPTQREVVRWAGDEIDLIRFAIDYESGNVAVWDANEAWHWPVMKALGIDDTGGAGVSSNSDAEVAPRRFLEMVQHCIDRGVGWRSITKEDADRVYAKLQRHDFTWDESAHPRGKTSPESTPGSFASGEAAGLLAAAIASGGFTYQPHDHVSAPPVGYAMSMDTANELAMPLADATADKIAEYINARAAMFTDKDTYVGAWIDTASGKLVLDISKVVRDRNEAMHLARTYKQEAIYDLEKGESVQVGAQGENRRFALGLLHRENAVQPALDDRERHRGCDHGKGEAGAGRLRPTTPDGKPRLVSMAAFQRAALRVDFSVLGRRTDLLTSDAAMQMARMVVKATLKLLGGEKRIAELMSTDMRDIEYLKFDGADVGKLKAIAKDALSKGWGIGAEAARREIAQARGARAVAVSFSALADRAADYFEANGFRMAANVSDGTRSIIQQVLIQAVKEGLRPEDVTPAMFRALIDKGFTTLAALELEMAEPMMLAQVARMLRVPASQNVAQYLNTLIRTNLFEALNEARFDQFTDPVLEGFVKAFEYTAILDDRTTELCRELDGMVFAADSPEWETFNPPNHFNCRSMLIGITETDDWDGKEDQTPKLMPAEGFTTLLDKRERLRERDEKQDEKEAKEAEE